MVLLARGIDYGEWSEKRVEKTNREKQEEGVGRAVLAKSHG